MTSSSKRNKKILAAIIAICIAASMFGGMSAFAASEKRTENILHYWAFDGDASDASGVLPLEAVSDGLFAEGKNGSALDTNSGSAFVSKELKENTVRGFTMGAWFRLDSEARDWNIIMSKGNTQDTLADRFQVHIGHASEEKGGGYLLAYAPAAGSTLSHEDDGQFVPFDTWTFVTVTYNGSMFRMYVNGDLAIEQEAQGTLDSSQKVYNTVTVGALNHDGQSLKFKGLIDDAFYANYPMTAKDIKDSFNDVSVLKAFSDGSREIVPDEMDETAATPTPAPTDSGSDPTGKILLFWPFENSTKDISHLNFNIDVEEVNEGFDNAKSGKGMMVELPCFSEELPEDYDMTEFTVSMWVRWDSNNHQTYTVPIAFARKETGHHFEIYFTINGDTGELAFYGTGNQFNVEHIANVTVEEFCHVVAVNQKNSFKLYLNGELVYTSSRSIVMKGIGTAADYISLGGLNDSSLICAGMYDELLIANYVLDDELIGKLYSDPDGAHEDVVRLVEANYPEGYTPPTQAPVVTKEPATPTPEQTEAVTAAPTENNEDTEKTPIPGMTDEPQDEEEVKKSGPNAGVIIAIVSGVVIASAAVIAALLIKKGKAK
ncbi:MAG: LamG domain-containing protein [Clostridia bacterium]|nr:LamG domain-containing protein [Clostridia bacterium]